MALLGLHLRSLRVSHFFVAAVEEELCQWQILLQQ
jgi:hypothetical protein